MPNWLDDATAWCAAKDAEIKILKDKLTSMEAELNQALFVVEKCVPTAKYESQAKDTETEAARAELLQKHGRVVERNNYGVVLEVKD